MSNVSLTLQMDPDFAAKKCTCVAIYRFDQPVSLQ